MSKYEELKLILETVPEQKREHICERVIQFIAWFKKLKPGMNEFTIFYIP